MKQFDWDPGTLLEMSGYYWKTCTLHAAVRLDIFSAIGHETLTAARINNMLTADLRGLTMLLNALCAMELLIKKGDTYTNTEPAKTFLCKSSEHYIGFMIMHHFHLVESWHHMDQAVKQGKPVEEKDMFSDEERRESFLMGMFNIGMAAAPQAARAVDLTGCRRLLDLGGGPGTFAIHFCMLNPELKAAVYDLGTTRPFALQTIDRFGLSDRVEFISGDYTRDKMDDIGEFDAAWLSHILHGEGPGQALDIIQKTVAALKPGSPILIHEFILDNAMDGPLFPALFSLNMYLRTPDGRSYSQGQLTDMLARCGVTEIKRLDFTGPTQSGILMGTTST